MTARIPNPASLLPEVYPAIQSLLAAARDAGVPEATLELVHLRVSQINGCSFCVDLGARQARKAGETEKRLAAVAAWRDAPYFTDAERAALELAEHATRLADRSSEPVPDPVWAEVARHHDDKGLAALVLCIATTNFFNRINASIKQEAGSW